MVRASDFVLKKPPTPTNRSGGEGSGKARRRSVNGSNQHNSSSQRWKILILPTILGGIALILLALNYKVSMMAHVCVRWVSMENESHAKLSNFSSLVRTNHSISVPPPIVSIQVHAGDALAKEHHDIYFTKHHAVVQHKADEKESEPEQVDIDGGAEEREGGFNKHGSRYASYRAGLIDRVERTLKAHPLRSLPRSKNEDSLNPARGEGYGLGMGQEAEAGAGDVTLDSQLEDVLFWLQTRPQCRDKPLIVSMANVGNDLYVDKGGCCTHETDMAILSRLGGGYFLISWLR